MQPRWWILLMCLSGAGFAAGALVPALMSVFYTEPSGWRQHVDVGSKLGALGAGWGLGIALGLKVSSRLWLRLILSAPLAGSGYWFVSALLFDGDLTLALVLAGPGGCAMTMAHHLFTRLGDRPRLAMAAPFAYLTLGATAALPYFTTRLLLEVVLIRDFGLAFGAMGGLLQYYGMVAAVALERRRAARTTPAPAPPGAGL